MQVKRCKRPRSTESPLCEPHFDGSGPTGGHSGAADRPTKTTDQHREAGARIRSSSRAPAHPCSSAHARAARRRLLSSRSENRYAARSNLGSSHRRSRPRAWAGHRVGGRGGQCPLRRCPSGLGCCGPRGYVARARQGGRRGELASRSAARRGREGGEDSATVLRAPTFQAAYGVAMRSSLNSFARTLPMFLRT